VPAEFWWRSAALGAAACALALVVVALKRRQLVYWV
jgi:hypothetical protein